MPTRPHIVPSMLVRTNRRLGAIDTSALPQTLFGVAFDTVELRTRLAPPVRFKINGPSDPATMAMLRRIQPAIIFTGNAGRYEIAPVGSPEGIDPAVESAGPLIGFGIGAALLGVLFIGKSLL